MEPLKSAHPVSEAFARRFAGCCGDIPVLPFSEFMQLSLYDREVGYYLATRRRVGTQPGTDFYTASGMKQVFAPLLVAAIVRLLGPNKAVQCVFVEIGPEPGEALLDGIPHPFASRQSVRVGEPITVPERAIVFSNELFDAQPFSRVVYRQGAWREMGVRLDGRQLSWAELPAFSGDVAAAANRLPVDAPDGYTIDLPLRAEALMRSLADASWTGLMLAFDYGRAWETLCTEHPDGTGRGYRAHRYASSLLDDAGLQDLTCHVCWDWLEMALGDTGFSRIGRTGQEAFFVKHSAEAIAAIMADNPSPVSAPRSQLKQLIHPALMGQRFEALWAVRE